MKKIFASAVLLILFCSTIPAQEPDEIFDGFLKPVFLKVISQIAPASDVAFATIEVKLDNTIVETDLGLSKKQSREFLQMAIAWDICTTGSTYLQANSKLNVTDYRSGVYPVLKDRKILPNDPVSDETAQQLINVIDVIYLITGSVEEKDGAWFLTLGDGSNSAESDPLDRDGMIKLIKRATTGYEDEPPPSPPPPPLKPTAETPRPQPSPPSIPPDRSDQIVFRNEGRRNSSMIFPLRDDLNIAIYTPRKNDPLASTIPAFVIFGSSGILKVAAEGGHTDIINGILLNPEKTVFHTYADDGLVIAYETGSFRELYRLNNNSRPVKNAALTANGYLVTNPGGKDSHTFNLSAKTMVNGSVNTGRVIPSPAADDTLQIKDGFAGVYGRNGEPLRIISLYEDDSCVMIFNGGKSFSGIGLIERHLNVIEYGKQPRLYNPSTDRRMRVDNNRI